MAAPIYRFRNFLLDPQAHELHQDGALVALPVSTLDCLTYLIQHRNRLVGRDELTAAVWGRTDVSEVSLSHAVMRLRRLLGDTGNDQRVIRTVPRLGYRWVMDVTVEQAATEEVVARAPPLAAQDEAAPIDESPQSQPSTSFRRRGVLAIATLLLIGAALATAAFLILRHKTPAQAPIAASRPHD